MKGSHGSAHLLLGHNVLNPAPGRSSKLNDLRIVLSPPLGHLRCEDLGWSSDCPSTSFLLWGQLVMFHNGLCSYFTKTCNKCTSSIRTEARGDHGD